MLTPLSTPMLTKSPTAKSEAFCRRSVGTQRIGTPVFTITASLSIAMMLVLFNLAADVLYRWVDPRIS